MTRRLLLLLIVALSLAATHLSAKPSALPPPVVPQCVGVNIHFTGQPKRDLDGLARGGFGWIRMDFAWDAIEKTKGVYDFSAYDSLLAGLTARHIKPLFILDYGNDLYQKGSPRTPEARAAFARFAAAAARHYRGKTILWEIWNEPNGGFWQPQANVQEYGALAMATVKAVHAADPNATVIAPGTSGIPLDFMESLFKMGLLKEVDAVSFHPYRGNSPETAAGDYQALRALIQRYAPPGRDVPLVSSEWGYTTVNVSEQQQAQYLARQWLSNLAEGIRLSIWYDWHDDGTDPSNGEHHFGTVRNDYTPKPAFLAARALTQTLGGSRFVKRIPLASPDDYLLLFGRGGAVRLAAWTTKEDHALPLPIASVTRMTDMTGGPLTPTVEGGRLRLTLTGSPVYLDVGRDAALREAAAWTARPENPFYAAGQPLRLALTYRNPDDVSHRVRFLTLLTTPDGARTPVPGGEDIVGPHQMLAQGAVSAAMRVPVRARVGLVVDDVRQPYPQDVSFTPTDPLTLSVTPLESGRAQVQIANPAGTEFTGRLGAAGPSGVTVVPVHLAAGQTALSVTTPLRAETTWRLRDEQGRPVAALPARRYVPYPLAASPIQVVLDGDLKVPSAVQLLPDKAAQRVSYQFAPGWSFWRAGEAQPPALPGHPAAYGVWVDGDDSGNNVNIRFTDSTEQTFQADGPAMTWSGWHYLTFPLQPGTPEGQSIGHWGGANDGRVHYPIRITTLLLLDSRAAARRHQGVVLWKRPDIIYDETARADGSAHRV
ncbi:MAG: cellulase family glycosylhydrolase [Armatimonadetes bacterium]|nr:cellulase family glycosylhydrolase [Armatimonadota bacterium]